MKKNLFVFLSALLLCCAYIKASEAQPAVMSAGITGGIGILTEVVPDDSDDSAGYKSEINNRLYRELGFFYEMKFVQPAWWFHDIYLSYGRSKGKYSYKSFDNEFYAETYTAMYRIGGYIMNKEGGPTRGFGYAGLGLALDRYLSGDFSDHTNFMLAGKPYLVCPLFCIGGGIEFERITINILEFRIDMRFQEQPQDEFDDYIEKGHWTGVVGLYSGIAYNF